MCGIAGIISFNNPTVGLAGTAKRMNDAIRHRGPDGEGYLLIGGDDETTAFGKDTPQAIIESSILHKPVVSIEDKGTLN